MQAKGDLSEVQVKLLKLDKEKKALKEKIEQSEIVLQEREEKVSGDEIKFLKISYSNFYYGI